MQIVIQVGQPEIPTQLAQPLGERDEHAEAGAVDVAGLAEVHEDLPRAGLGFVEHPLLEFLAIAHDELPFDLDDDDIALTRDAETHDCLLGPGFAGKDDGGNLARNAAATLGCTSASMSPPNRATSRTNDELR